MKKLLIVILFILFQSWSTYADDVKAVGYDGALLLPEDARFHDLRHEALSRFFEVKNLNVPEVQLISGHLEPRTLMRVYANLRPQDLANKLAKL
jgi:integrase